MKLTPAPKIQFFGDDGLPLSGGKVFTYEQGTTTPLATYSDPSGGSVNTNPVILDTYGRASIYIQDLAYTFLVKDADDVVQGAGGDVPNPAIDTTDFLERTSLTGSAEVPVGNTAQRDPTPTVGYFRFNTTIGHFEGWDGTEWVKFYDETDKELALGNPAANGLGLVSTTGGTRSWGIPTVRNTTEGVIYTSAKTCYYDFIQKVLASGRFVSVDGVKCISWEGSTILTPSNGNINTDSFAGANQVFGLYAGKRADNGNMECFPLALTELGNVAFAAYSYYNLLSVIVNDSSGYVRRFYQRDGKITWPIPTDMPIVAAATTTSFAAYNPSTIIPNDTVSEYELEFIATAACTVNISYDGSSIIQTFTFTTSDLQKSFIVPSILAGLLQLRHVTSAVAVKIKSVKLRTEW